MDFPEAKTLPARPAWERVALLAAVLALAIYTVVLVRHVGAVAGSSDTSGYMNHARLLASGHVHVAPRIIPGLPVVPGKPMLYSPLGFRPAWDGDGLVPTYPAGLPLLVLAAAPFAGWRYAGDLAIILHSLAGLAATYLLGSGARVRARRVWATLAATIVAISPVYLFMSLQAMSDVPSLVWTTLAVLAALKSRKAPAWALAAGAALAIDVLLRPTNVLAFAPVAVALGASPRRWLLLGLGGLPGLVVYCAHSAATYGSLAATGYGDSSFDFGTRFVSATLFHYALWLPALFTPIVALILGLPWLGRQYSREKWLIGIWIVAFAGFYSFYKCTHETWWSLRFLLPAAPAMVVGSLLVLRSVLSRLPARALFLYPAVVVAAFALAAVSSSRRIRTLFPLLIGKDELRYGLVAEWMDRKTRPRTPCACPTKPVARFSTTRDLRSSAGIPSTRMISARSRRQFAPPGARSTRSFFRMRFWNLTPRKGRCPVAGSRWEKLTMSSY